MGKTLIAKSFAAALGLHFARVQFTPDLLPPICSAPLSTTCIRAVFEFRKGPIFTNLLLADEINRTSPKTQAALLEAMAERRVGIDGITHPLPAPFLVLANDIRSKRGDLPAAGGVTGPLRRPPRTALPVRTRRDDDVAGRDFVIPEDIKSLAVPALAHRIRLRPRCGSGGCRAPT